MPHAKTFNPPRSDFGLLGLGAAAIAILFAFVLVSNRRLIYDEGPYLAPIALLRADGLSRMFLQDYPEPAGLLNVVLQAALAPLTGLRAPGVRLVNPVLLLASIGFIALTARQIGDARPLSVAAALVAVPSVWVVSGMALTEMLAFALLSASLWLLIAALARQRRPQAGAMALAGGFALGLAFLDRAPTIVILAALPCLLIAPGGAVVAICFALGALGVALPVLWMWGGLVPPHSAVPVTLDAISIRHLVDSVAYAAFAMLVLSPAWFRRPSKLLASAILALSAADAASGYIVIVPFRTLMARWPELWVEIEGRLLGAAMVALAALFLISTVERILERRRDPARLFLGVAMLLLIVAPAKIVHQFSSRYVMLASGVMLLVGAPFVEDDRWRTARVGAGACLGFATLVGYYLAD